MTTEEKLAIATEALRKIDEPHVYHHREPDDYTQVACFQHVAHEARKAIGDYPPKCFCRNGGKGGTMKTEMQIREEMARELVSKHDADAKLIAQELVELWVKAGRVSYKQEDRDTVQVMLAAALEEITGMAPVR